MCVVYAYVLCSAPGAGQGQQREATSINHFAPKNWWKLALDGSSKRSRTSARVIEDTVSFVLGPGAHQGGAGQPARQGLGAGNIYSHSLDK